MSKTKSALLAMGLAFITIMIVLAVTGGKQAKNLSDAVLRFHIVAASDSAEDQAIKYKVRDGIAGMTDLLFRDAATKEEAIAVARKHTGDLAAAAEEILRQNGSDDAVSVTVDRSFFPTKRYENVTFPAGVYDAIHIDIGAAEGKNFWCVMFPSLCVPSVTKDNAKLLGEVVGGEEIDLVTHPYSLRFRLVEWWNTLTSRK